MRRRKFIALTTEEKNRFTAIAQKHKAYPAATPIRPRAWSHAGTLPLQ
jgi:hypothetical protein